MNEYADPDPDPLEDVQPKPKADQKQPPPGGPQQQPGGSKKTAFKPTLYEWRDPALIPPRAFIGGRHLIRKFLSVTVATGGVGKSSLVLADAVALASGRKLHGADPEGKFKVWYWNGEDPREEVERRVVAIMKHYCVSSADIGDRLFFDSGRDDGMEIIIASQTKHATIIARPVEDALTETLIAGKFDVLMIDPFVATHRVTENDNMAIDAIAKTLGRIKTASGATLGIYRRPQPSPDFRPPEPSIPVKPNVPEPLDPTDAKSAETLRQERGRINRLIAGLIVNYPADRCLHCRKPIVAGQPWIPVSNGEATARFHKPCHTEWLGQQELAARRVLGLDP